MAAKFKDHAAITPFVLGAIKFPLRSRSVEERWLFVIQFPFSRWRARSEEYQCNQIPCSRRWLLPMRCRSIHRAHNTPLRSNHLKWDGESEPRNRQPGESSCHPHYTPPSPAVLQWLWSESIYWRRYVRWRLYRFVTSMCEVPAQ